MTGRNGVNCNNATQGLRDVYCTIALDQEEINRTQIIEKNLNPFFGEEFQFQIPRKFRYLSVYLWDRDKHLKQDKPIGKIAIKKEDLHIYNHKDHWFPLRPVDADSEVQGMIHIATFIDNGQGQNIFESNNRDECVSVGGSSSGGGGGGNECKENSSGIGLDSGGCGGTTTRSDGGGGVSVGSSGRSGLWQSNKKTNMLDTIGTYKTDNYKNRICLKVNECVDLTKKNGNCDPYVVITGLYSNKRKIVKRTKIKRKTTNPTFDEIFYYDLTIDNDTKGDHHHSNSNNTYTVVPLGGSDLIELSISLWHDIPGIGISINDNNIFLGEIKLQIRGKQLQQINSNGIWYFLQPRINNNTRQIKSCATPPGTRLSCDNSLGSLRIKLNYTSDYVFPLATYDQLMNLLIMSIDTNIPIHTTTVYILGEIISNKMDISQPLVRLFTYKNLISKIIKKLADHEISKLTDPTTIFRGNTLVSKMMDEAMKLSGLHYLHNTLRPILDEIIQEKKPCEIDPTKVKDQNQIASNLQNLTDYLEKIFEAITKSAVKCPPVLCQIFHDLRECAAKHFPINNEVRYSVVSGFIFLRFFAPAILGPKLFDLTSEPVDAQTNRTLTLISKTIQSLGNLVSSRSAQQPCKEEYTGQLYKQFFTEKHIESVKHFLEVISTVGASVNGDTLLEPVLLKEG